MYRYMKCMYSLVSERTVPVRHSLSPPLCNEIIFLLNPGVQTVVLVFDFSKEQSDPTGDGVLNMLSITTK